MFTREYFAPRYFAPRYFPEFGGLLPPTFGSIRLTINGVDRTNFIHEASSMSWNLMLSTRGTASIPFILGPSDTFASQIGDTVEIWDPFNARRWAGVVMGVALRWIGDRGNRIRTVTCATLEKIFDTDAVDRVRFANVTVASIITALHAASGTSIITLGVIDTGPTVESLEVTNLWQGMAAAAQYGGFVLYVDPIDLTLNCHAPLSRDSEANITRSEDILWETSEWVQSAADYRSDQQTQITGPALDPVTENFVADGVTTDFELSDTPAYLISVDVSIGLSARTVTWIPGSKIITIEPELPDTTTVSIKYALATAATASVPSMGLGRQTFVYTRTRTFTAEGAAQEAAALLKLFASLPAQLTLSTYKPGICIGRKLSVNITYPITGAEVMNGDWLVQEVEGSIVPGLEMQAEPYGHFRYTAHLVSGLATAVFRGDGSTTAFLLPEIPDSVTSIDVVGSDGHSTDWVEGTGYCNATPAPPEKADVVVRYTPPSNRIPIPPTFVQTWESLADKGVKDAVALGGGAEEAPGAIQATYLRTLLIRNTAVADDVADHVTVYASGTGAEIEAVLRKPITSDLVVRINKNGVELLTVTIDHLTVGIDDPQYFPILIGSPPILAPFVKGEILTVDVLDSDGSSDAEGVCSFTIIWDHT
jgi:hypothetical protein